MTVVVGLSIACTARHDVRARKQVIAQVWVWVDATIDHTDDDARSLTVLMGLRNFEVAEVPLVVADAVRGYWARR